MTNENVPELVLPSGLGFPVEQIITTSAIDEIVKGNPNEWIELIKARDNKSLEIHNKNLEFTIERLRLTEITKRLGMGLVFGLFVSILIYSVVSGDKALTEKVVIGSISAVAGAGGVLINQPKDK